MICVYAGAASIARHPLSHHSLRVAPAATLHSNPLDDSHIRRYFMYFSYISMIHMCTYMHPRYICASTVAHALKYVAIYRALWTGLF